MSRALLGGSITGRARRKVAGGSRSNSTLMFLKHRRLLVQPFGFPPPVSHLSVLPQRFTADSPRSIHQTAARRRGRRRPTRKSLGRMNLLYLLLCYAIIETEECAGQKEMMVFTQQPLARSATPIRKTTARPGHNVSHVTTDLMS